MPSLHSSVKITLVENSTAGNPPKVFAAQTVEISSEPDTFVMGVDGHLSVGRHPSTIFGRGGVAKDIANITNVEVVGSKGEVLINGELNKTFVVPRDVPGGVKFAVL